MENNFIAILLVSIIVIYIFINPNEKIEPFANIEEADINKSLEEIIEDSETLKILNKNNKVKVINYKNDSRNFLNHLKNKYKKYYELKMDTNFNNFGRKCDNWDSYDAYKNLKGNKCKQIDGNDYKCIVDNGKMTSCSLTKLYDKNIQNDVYKNKNIKKSTNIYQNAYHDIDKSLEYYDNILSKEIRKYKSKQDIIINQKYLLGQQKNYIKLQREKLNKDEDNYTETNNNFNINYNKTVNEREKIKIEKQNLIQFKYYIKMVMFFLIILIFIKMLYLKI